MTRDHRRKNPITMMPCFNSSGDLLFLCLLIFLGLGTRVTSDPLSYSCPNIATYTPNSIYKANLNTLFSALSYNAARTSGFYNFTAGANSPDAVYGLFLCRGDVSAAACRDCVVTVSYEIKQLCPRQKVAVIWYDNCLLRYSNRNIFSIPDRSASLTMYNVQSIRDPIRFNQLLGVTMDDVATRAANDQSGKKFATKEANFTAFQKLYGLAQCTPDLSSAGCNSCLRDAISAIPSCCNGRRGGRVVFSSCYVRYELYPFYNKAAASPPALVFPPPLPRSLPLPSPRLRPHPIPRPCRTSNPGEEEISSQALIAIIFAIVVFAFAFITGGFSFLAAKGKKKYDALPQEDTCKEVGIEIKTVQPLEYDLATIQAATNNFSDDNKIGEGGFGNVYKGALPSGQKIAVKRLSPNSGQGAEEFQNEVALVARLQHRNLVKLLGFCLEGEEKILIYEIVPNKSLNYFLFDRKKQEKLDWSRRYKIIRGIARGILYLHEDSGFRIIHRDLKASNILLDGDMNAKISDFGMARIFGVDQTRGNTNRVVGTYGYMSPEYAIRGQFSVKSDVFSFGVLVLEIISGKKNSSFYQSDCAEDIPSYAWKLWTAGTPLELMDPSLKGSYSSDEVTRCIHIGLLCVQEDPDARPSTASVVLMLSSFSATLPVPQQPALFARSKTGLNGTKGAESDQSTSKSMQWSLNEASITEQYPR